jgi:O-antigen/teichoic acid export membrane protein
MIYELKKLGKHSLIYGLGNTVSKAIAFILIPLYTAYLTPGDYGVLQLCRLLNSVLTIVLLLGMSSSMFRVYYKVSSNEDRQLLINSTFITFIFFSILVLVPLYIFSSTISKAVIGYENSQYVFNILILSIFLESFFSLQLAVLRAEERSKLYTLVNLIRIVLYTLLSILFISYLKLNFVGSIQAGLFSFIIVIIILVPYSLKKFNFKVSFEYIKEILHIGIPLAVGGLGLWVLNLSDRYMMRFFLPENIAMIEIGLYSLGDRIASVLKFIIIMPFMLAWGALMFQFAKESNAQALFERVFRFLNIIMGITGLFLSIFAKEIIQLLSQSEDFYTAYKVVPILVFSKIFAGLIVVISAGVIVTKKSIFVTIANLSAALLNITLNYFLIIKYGMYGAAIASMISFIYAFLLLHYFSVKYFKIDWKIYKNMFFLTYLFIASVCCVYLDFSLVYKILIFMTTIIVLPIMKMVEKNEFDRLIRIIRAGYEKMFSNS